MPKSRRLKREDTIGGVSPDQLHFICLTRTPALFTHIKSGPRCTLHRSGQEERYDEDGFLIDEDEDSGQLGRGPRRRTVEEIAAAYPM